MSAREQRHVVIVGGGFAGLGCAQRLAEHDDVRVTLIDRNNYHQFQPLLYQVATSQLAPSDIAHSLRIGVRRPETTSTSSSPRSPRSTPRRGPSPPTDGGAMDRGRARAWRPARSRTSSARPGAAGELVPAVLARRRHPAAVTDPRPVRAGRPRPGAARARRAELRDRRRRPDRGRSGGRDRRHALGDGAGRVRGPRCRRRRRSHLLDYGDALLTPFSTRPTATWPRC